MAQQKRRKKFERPLGNRPYRKLFVIATEGEKTEPQYFALFTSRESVIKVKCLKDGHQSSPEQVLKKMKAYLEREEELKKTDEAWLVVDKDQWEDSQLDALASWARQTENYNLAVSNPQFEYWLLLHFEEGKGITETNCLDRLRHYLPNYDKGIDTDKITAERIASAIARARRRDAPPCTDWPHQPGRTTVYRLVEKLAENSA